jgi:hypothetical protein
VPDPVSGTARFDAALTAWGRRKRLATAVFTAVLVGAATVTVALPSLYRSTATLLVERPGGADEAGRSTSTGEIEARLRTIGEEVLSRKRLEALMDRFDLYPELRSRGKTELAVERLRGDIEVKLKGTESEAGRPSTIAFRVSFRGRHPATVARVTNALASFYVEETLNIRERAHLARLGEELSRMQGLYSDQYPDVRRLRAEIAAIERGLADGEGAGPGAAIAPGMRLPPPRSKGELGLLRAEEPKRRPAAGAPRRGGGVEGPVLERYQSAGMTVGPPRGRAGGEIRILDPAISSPNTVAPNRVRLLLVGVLFAVGATVAAVLLAEHLDTSFHTLDELRTFTRVPVLASIPRLTTSADLRQQPSWLTAASIAGGLALVMLASYSLAHGNDQLVRILSRGAS